MTGGAAAIPGHHVIEIQVLALKDPTAELAGVLVALDDVVAGELDLLFGKAVEHHQQDDPGNADAEGHRGDRLLVVRSPVR